METIVIVIIVYVQIAKYLDGGKTFTEYHLGRKIKNIKTT